MAGRTKVTNINDKLPAPNEYNLSYNRNNMGIKFPTENRTQHSAIVSNPGPGQYDVNAKHHNVRKSAPAWR